MLTNMYYFLAVVENKSITRAAQQLYISQPALSASIIRLEKKLGATLISRDSKNFHLTPQGECVQHYASQICSTFEKMKNELELLNRQNKGTLRLGGAMRHIVSIVDNFLYLYPEYNIIFTQYNSCQDMKRALLTGEIDLCLSAPPITGTGIYHESLCVEQLCALFNEDCSLRSKKSVSLQDLCKYKILALPPGFPLREISDQLFIDHNLSVKYVMQAENNALAMIINKAKSQDYVTIYPYSRCIELHAMYPSIFYCKLDENCTRTITMSYLENAPRPEPFWPLIECIRDYYSDKKYNSSYC